MRKYLYAAFLFVALAAVMAPAQMLAATADEEKPFTIHGEVRFRGEYTNNTEDFLDQTATNPPAESDDGAFFWAYRARIAAEGRFTKNVVGWIEFQQTGAGGEDFDGPRQVDDRASDVHLYQGKVTLNELWSKNFSLTFGRTEMVAGNEFILGDEDFYGGIAHDGVMANWGVHKNWNLMLWATRPVEDSVGTTDVDVTPDQRDINGDAENVDFMGGYATWNFGKSLKQTLDFYLVNAIERGVGAQFQTAGVRYAHDVRDKNGIFWNVEVAQQFGTASTAPIPGGTEVDASGQAIEGWVGFNLHSGKNNHQFWGRLESASGDDTSATSADDFEGFIGLFGDFHNRAGHGDWFHVQATDLNGVGSTGLDGGVGAAGLTAFAVGYTGYFGDKHEVGAAYWDYSTDEDIDLDTSAVVQNEDELGQAFDVWYSFSYSTNVAFQVSYSSLSPGDALTLVPGAPPTSGPDDSVERLYGQVRLRF